ncbi:MAG TPA: hypothetical protein VFH63_03215 [candidate division Zixibacteria bacterium]|nr:hypothetical protein [candidate division Zixibacteria bacterium]
MPLQRVGELEIDHDLAFQRREWIMERIGWTAMLVIAVAGLLGLFGTGLLSAAEAQGEGNLLLRYGRFERFNAPAELAFTVPAEAASPDGTFGISISRDYLAAVQVEAITPEPADVAADGDWLTYTFASSTPGSITVVFHLEHDAIGPRQLLVRLGDGEPMAIGQFVYP